MSIKIKTDRIKFYFKKTCFFEIEFKINEKELLIYFFRD
jgi:hypothetical protein